MAGVFGISTSFDAGFFGRRPPSAFMADNAGAEKDRCSLARLLLSNLVLSVSGSDGVLKLSAGAGDVRVLDTRVPVRTLHPVFLHCGPSSLRQNGHGQGCAVAGLDAAAQGFADPNFGFTTNTSDVRAALPLQVRRRRSHDEYLEGQGILE
jgi:hypothetical protein